MRHTQQSGGVAVVPAPRTGRAPARGIVATGMLVARLHNLGEPLRLELLPRPQPRGDEVLVRVAAAGLGRADLRAMDGEVAGGQLPLVPGREVAGYVAALGPQASGVEIGDAVVVQPTWGCGHCDACRHGDDHLCAQAEQCGSTRPGGFADFLLVPHARHLVHLHGVDPVLAAPLADAALTPYHAVRSLAERLGMGTAVVVIGGDALGQFAVQLLRALTPVRVVLVEPDLRREAAGREAGAHDVVDIFDMNAVAAGLARHPAVAVIDTVGSEGSLDLAARAVAPQGVVVATGPAGGRLRTPLRWLPAEASFSTVRGGGRDELEELVELAASRRIRLRVQRFQLDRANDAVTAVRAGWVSHRAVLVPEMF